MLILCSAGASASAGVLQKFGKVETKGSEEWSSLLKRYIIGYIWIFIEALYTILVI